MKNPAAIILSIIALTFCFAERAMGQWVQLTATGGGPVNCFAQIGPHLFAGTENGGVYRSDDDGISWTSLNSGLPDTTIYSFAISGTNLFVGTWTKGVFRSSDSGSSWHAAGIEGNEINALAASGTNLYAGTFSNGVFYSSDSGATWKPESTGMSKTYVLSLAASGSNVMAGLFGGGVDYSSDMGASWSHAMAVPCSVPALTMSDISWYAGSYCEGVYLSTDEGTYWQAVDSGMTNKIVQTLISSGTDLFTGTWGGGVFFSADGGTNWRVMNEGLANLFVLSLARSNKYVFAGTRGGDIWRRPLSDFGINSVISSDKPDQDFSISPNPTTGMIRVHSQVSQTFHVTITNILGQRVMDQIQINSPTTELDLSNLVAGTYLAHFSFGKEEFLRDIIKE